MAAMIRSPGSVVSLTGRSAGTDMTGGPLSQGIIVSFTKYFNHIEEINADAMEAKVQPGVYFRDFEKVQSPETLAPATQIFHRYEEIMLAYYHREVTEIPGAADTFRWCHDHGIKVATGTGFHRQITEAIMDGLGWLRDGLVDISVDVEHTPQQRGRPAPFMIFHAMTQLDIQCVNEVVKVGDTPADMLEGANAGCRGIVGVLSGPLPVTAWGGYRHTHVIPSVKVLPQLIEAEFA